MKSSRTSSSSPLEPSPPTPTLPSNIQEIDDYSNILPSYSTKLKNAMESKSKGINLSIDTSGNLSDSKNGIQSNFLGIEGTTTNSSGSPLLFSPSKTMLQYFKSKSTPKMDGSSPTSFRNKAFSSPSTKIENFVASKKKLLESCTKKTSSMVSSQQDGFLALTNMLEQTDYFGTKTGSGLKKAFPQLPPIQKQAFHSNSMNSLFATAQNLSQTEQSKVFSNYFQGMTDEEILKHAAEICNFFGFSHSKSAVHTIIEEDLTDPLATLHCLSFLEGLKARAKISLKCMEKEWNLKKKSLKEEAIKSSFRDSKTIEKLFEYLLSKYPPEARYINNYVDGIISKWKNISDSRNDSRDVLARLLAVCYYLKHKIKILRQVNGLRKYGSKRKGLG